MTGPIALTPWMIAVASLVAVVILAFVAATLLRVGALVREGAAAARESAGFRARFDALASSVANHERDVRGDLAASRSDAAASALALRGEMTAAATRLRGELTAAAAQLREELTAAAAQLREELTAALARQQQGLVQQQQALVQQQQGLETRLEAMRRTVEERLDLLRAENMQKLDQMRATVDEKLQATLEQRLGASFKQVSERLEQVHRGLGEMQSLAIGVGDLKRVLVNVKTRGTWGEVQLGAILADMLQPAQYAQNVATRPGSAERVEFAIRLPGRSDDGAPCWLPIDAKFPLEDWQRLQDAIERADAAAVDASRKALDQFFKQQARMIRDKYVEPPHTTDFAILFVPTEGLFAEAVARPGLADTLQREFRVTLAGPSNLAAMLNSLQLGFRTLAIEKRSTEVWRVLGAVKTEFGRFGEILAKTRDKLEQVGKTLDDAGRKSTTIARRLREVEALPEAEAERLLGRSAGNLIDTASADSADADDATGATSDADDSAPRSARE